jgi:hypothetical protein
LARGWSTNATGVPFLTFVPSKAASQIVNRTHPWDSALLTLEGLGEPWRPYPSANNPIQYDPTGLFGSGLLVNGFLDFTLELILRIISVGRIGICRSDVEAAARGRLFVAADGCQKEADQRARWANAFFACRSSLGNFQIAVQR